MRSGRSPSSSRAIVAASPDAEDLAEHEFVDERPARIVREDAVQAGELAAQARCRDREQDRDRDLRELEVASEHVEWRQPSAATALGGEHHLLGRTLAIDGSRELVRRAPRDEPEQAADLVGERWLDEIGLADAAAVPCLGDRHVDARADELQPQIDRLADLGGGRVRRDGDRIEPHERRVGEMIGRLDDRFGHGDLGDRFARDRDGFRRAGTVGRRVGGAEVDGFGRRDGRERVGAHELESGIAAERDPLQSVVDRELGRPRRQLEIADPAAEPQIEDPEAIARAYGREAAACSDREVRDLRQAQLRVRRTVGDGRDREPELARFVAGTRRALLREYEQPTVEHDLRVECACTWFAKWLAPRLADAPPQPELTALPQQPPAIGDRQDDVAARTGDLGADRIGAYDDRLRGVPDRERRGHRRDEKVAGGIEIIDPIRGELATVAKREPCEVIGGDHPQLLTHCGDINEIIDFGTKAFVTRRVIDHDVWRLGGQQISACAEEPQDPMTTVGTHRIRS